MEFHERVKKIRIKRGLSEGELAGILGVSDDFIYDIESNSRVPDIFFLPPLAKALSVTIDYLLTGSEGSSIPSSNLEAYVRNDDIDSINDLTKSIITYKDDKNNSVFSYILKYNAKNILDNILKNNKLSEIEKNVIDVEGLFSCLIKFDYLDELIKLRFFVDEAKDPLAIFTKARMNIYSDLGFDIYMRYLSYPGRVYDKIFNRYKNDLINPTNSWQELYSKAIYYAIKNDRDDLAIRLSNLIVKINNSALDAYLKKDGGGIISKSHHEITLRPREAYFRDSIYYALVSVDKKSIEALLEKGYLDEAEALYSVNLRFDVNLVPTGLFDECILRRDGETNKNKLFVASCIDNGIINIDKLIKCNNFYLIKNALYEYPIEVDEVKDNSNAKEINNKYLEGKTPNEARRALLDSLYPRLVNKERDLMTPEYFTSLLNDNNIDMLVIKLAVRLEGILKTHYKLEGTFEEMINLCNASEEITELFHKLRKQRNSAVHADRVGLKLTKEELKKLIKYISKMEE